MSSARPSCAPPAARAARSRGSAASVRCAACTTRRTRPAPRPARWRSASAPKSCKTACAAFPVSRIAWSRSAAAATCCSSTIPRAPMPMRRRMRCRPLPIFSGSPAASRSSAASPASTEYFPRIRKAYLIGEAAQEFAATLGDRVPHEISETLEVAVANAARDAEASGLADPVVLLSPACASFDQYRNFEIRGAAVPRPRHRAARRQAGGVRSAVGRDQRHRPRRRAIQYSRGDAAIASRGVLDTRFRGMTTLANIPIR